MPIMPWSALGLTNPNKTRRYGYAIVFKGNSPRCLSLIFSVIFCSAVVGLHPTPSATCGMNMGAFASGIFYIACTMQYFFCPLFVTLWKASKKGLNTIQIFQRTPLQSGIYEGLGDDEAHVHILQATSVSTNKDSFHRTKNRTCLFGSKGQQSNGPGILHWGRKAPQVQRSSAICTSMPTSPTPNCILCASLTLDIMQSPLLAKAHRRCAPWALCYIFRINGDEHPPNWIVMGIVECEACKHWHGRGKGL